MDTTRKIILKRDLQTDINHALNGKISTRIISEVIDALEVVCKSHLKKATLEYPVTIKLMKGLILKSEMLPEKEINTFDNKSFVQSERLRATARFTRYFNRYSLNNLEY